MALAPDHWPPISVAVFASSTRASRGRKFQNWNAYSLRSGTKNVPVGCGQAFCASQQKFLDMFWHIIPVTSLFTVHLFSSSDLISCRLISPHLISSHLILSNPMASSHLMSCRVFSTFFTSPHLISPHLISSHVFSPLLSSSQLFSVDLICSHLFSCHLSFSHLFSAHLNSSPFSSSQLLHSMQLVSTQLFSALLISVIRKSSFDYIVLTDYFIISDCHFHAKAPCFICFSMFLFMVKPHSLWQKPPFLLVKPRTNPSWLTGSTERSTFNMRKAPARSKPAETDAFRSVNAKCRVVHVYVYIAR